MENLWQKVWLAWEMYLGPFMHPNRLETFWLLKQRCSPGTWNNKIIISLILFAWSIFISTLRAKIYEQHSIKAYKCLYFLQKNTEIVMFLMHRLAVVFASHPTPAEGRLGAHKELGGNPADQRDIPYTQHHAPACRAGRRIWKEGMFRVTAFFFPSHHWVWWCPALLWMKHLLSHGRWWMNSLFCLPY